MVSISKLLRVIPTMTFQNSLLTQLLSEAFVTALWPNQLSQSFVSPGRSLCMSVCQTLAFLSGILIWHSYLAFYLALYLTFYLAFLSGILIWHSYLAFFSGILSGIPSGILIWHSYLAFFSGILSGTLSDVLSGILSDISFGILSGGRGPAGNTWRGFSRLRSGREHWAWMVVVEVRQGTLGVDSRGWGPAGNTTTIHAQCSLPDLNLAWMVVVEVRRRRKAAEGGGRPRKSTDIKSNNPHLAGGEKWFDSSPLPYFSIKTDNSEALAPKCTIYDIDRWV